MGFFDALSRGLERSREALNEVFYFGGEVDEDFWEDLEDTLVMGDMGAEVAIKVSDDLRDAVSVLPLDRVLLETDAPYLTPRGFHLPRTNVPNNIVYVAQTLASYMHVPVQELMAHAKKNTETLFRL